MTQTDPSAALLMPVLFFTSLISLTVLSFLLTLFLAHRLYTHLVTAAAQSGSSGADYDTLSRGVKGWLNETGDRLPAMHLMWRYRGEQWHGGGIGQDWQLRFNDGKKE